MRTEIEVRFERVRYEDPAFPIVLLSERACGEAAWHEDMELLYAITGSARLRLGAAESDFHAGGLALVAPECEHALRMASDDFACAKLLIDIGHIRWRRYPIDRDFYRGIVRGADEIALFAGILREMSERPPLYRQAALALTDCLLTRLCRAHDEKAPREALGRNEEMIRESLRYIREHYYEDICLEQISKHLNVSKFHFCRMFKIHMGMGVSSYVNELRCEYARKLLASGACNVTEAGRRAGYNTASHFTQTYRQQYGHLPSKEARC